MSQPRINSSFSDFCADCNANKNEFTFHFAATALAKISYCTNAAKGRLRVRRKNRQDPLELI
jgi:hypothetical protein